MPFDLHRELNRIATDIAPGALRRHALERVIARLLFDRARTRSIRDKSRLSAQVRHVRFVLRTAPDAGEQGAAS